MKRSTFLIILMIFGLKSFSQDCLFYYPQKQGATLEYKNYNSKDKLTGSSVQLIKEYKESSDKLEAMIEVEFFDKKGESQGNNEFKVQCENGVYLIDMKSFMNYQTMSAYKDMDVEVIGDNLKTPANLKPGDALSDGKLEIKVSNEGMPLMNMVTEITDRKVEAIEEVTTEAGTFKCLKITYTLTMKTMFSIRMEAAEWIAEGIGMVKSETYSKGKSKGYTLLTRLKK